MAKIHPRKLLIVDDDPSTTLSLGLIFSAKGYETRTAQRADEAGEIITAWMPDAAIIDVGLAPINGIELAILLKDYSPACRLLLFSGQPDTRDLLKEAEDNGHCFRVLGKPVPPTVLLDAVSELLGTQTPDSGGARFGSPVLQH